MPEAAKRPNPQIPYPEVGVVIEPTAPYWQVETEAGVWVVWVSGWAESGLRLEVEARLPGHRPRPDSEMLVDVETDGQRLEGLGPYSGRGGVRDGWVFEIMATYWLPVRVSAGAPMDVSLRLWDESDEIAPVICSFRFHPRRLR